jgi:hypothetical protein
VAVGKWESRVLCGFSNLFHSPSRRHFVQQQPFFVVPAQSLRPVGEGESSVQMLMHPHRTSRQCRSPANRFERQAEILKAHRVIPIDHPLKLQAEDQIQVLTASREKGRSAFGRSP